MSTIPYCVEELVKAGIEVTIEEDKKNNVIGFNLNPKTKSGMFLYKDEKTSEWYISGRYDFLEKVNDLYDIMAIFWRFYQMRDFGCENWLEFLADKDFIQRKVEKKTTYSR